MLVLVRLPGFVGVGVVEGGVGGADVLVPQELPDRGDRADARVRHQFSRHLVGLAETERHLFVVQDVLLDEPLVMHAVGQTFGEVEFAFRSASAPACPAPEAARPPSYRGTG